MKKISNPIVFFGSGPVAAESLRLLMQDFEIEAVVTKPTTEKEMNSVARGIPIYTVSKKSELDNLFEEQSFASQIGVLIDFGIIVSQKVISYFPLGIVNSHFSVLPQWRGADPINFAILSGQKTTGVSLMLLVEAMDEGPLLLYSTYEIPANVDSPTLTHDLIHISHDMLKNTLPQYIQGSVTLASQSRTKREISYSRKLTKADGTLDFNNKTAKQLEAEVRAFIQWPKSRTQLAGKDVVVTRASVDEDNSGTPGTITKTEDKKIAVATKKGTLIIEALKPAGKKDMSSEAFLAGHGSKL